jgi:hypothetical protein
VPALEPKLLTARRDALPSKAGLRGRSQSRGPRDLGVSRGRKPARELASQEIDFEVFLVADLLEIRFRTKELDFEARPVAGLFQNSIFYRSRWRGAKKFDFEARPPPGKLRNRISYVARCRDSFRIEFLVSPGGGIGKKLDFLVRPPPGR